MAVLYGGGSSTTGNYTGYDAVGRPIVSFQKTDTSVYRMDYGYDLSGELISETYPGTTGTNRRVVRTECDPAGRIAGIRNGATGPYYADDATNRIAYHRAERSAKLLLAANLIGCDLAVAVDYNVSRQRGDLKR